VYDRIQQYTNTLTSILGAAFASEAKVSVILGQKVFTNSTERRKLQIQGGGTDDLGDCSAGYTSLTANIVVDAPIPQPQIEAIIAALPDNVLNLGQDQVFQCSPSTVLYNDDGPIVIPAPPSPPETPLLTVVWATVWGLLALFSCCFCCCVVYGILAWRRGLYNTEEKDRGVFYEGTKRNNAEYIIYGKSRGFPFGRSAGREDDKEWGKGALVAADEQY